MTINSWIYYTRTYQNNMFKIFRQTRRTIPREVLEIVHPASLVATVVSHGSETCPNMGDDGPQPLVSCLKTDLQMAPDGSDGSVLEISSKWLEIPVWVDRLHSMFVFLLLGFNPHVQLILIDIPW